MGYSINDDLIRGLSVVENLCIGMVYLFDFICLCLLLV